MDEPSVIDELGAVLDELIELVAEAKEAKWLTTGTKRGQVSALFDQLIEAVRIVAELDDACGAPQLPVTTPSGRVRAPLGARTDADLLDVLADDLQILALDIDTHADAISALAEPAAIELRRIAEGLRDAAHQFMTDPPG